MEMIKIYILRHPESKEIRYVGYTKLTLEKRLEKHMRDSNNHNHHRANWIKSLPSEPIIEEIDNGLYEDRNWMEIMYIALFKSWGFRLVNGTVGGDGGDTFSNLSEEAKEQCRQKLSAHALKSNLGKNKSAEHIAKTKEHINSYNAKIKSGEITHPSLGRKLTAEQRKACSHNLGKASKQRGKSKYGSIQQIDLNTGEIINIYDSPGFAAFNLLADEPAGSKKVHNLRTNIVKTAKGKQKSCHGYKWQFM